MALTAVETQLQFSATNTGSVTAGSEVVSDAFTIHATTIGASISLKAVKGATPASDDKVDVYILYTNGDTDGAGGSDEYDAQDVVNSTFLCQLDCSQDAAAGVAQQTITIDHVVKGAQLWFDGAVTGNTNTLTVSARLKEQRAAA